MIHHFTVLGIYHAIIMTCINAIFPKQCLNASGLKLCHFLIMRCMCQKEKISNSFFCSQLTPYIHHPVYVFRFGGLVDSKEHLPLHPYIAFILKCRKQRIKMLPGIIITRIGLLNQQTVTFSIGIPHLLIPGTVCPMQHKRKVVFLIRKHIIQRLFQKALSVSEPVIIICKTIYAMILCHLLLCMAHFGKAQIIKTKICRYAGLFMPFEEWLGLRHISPLGKSFSVPLVILRYRMKLG